MATRELLTYVAEAMHQKIVNQPGATAIPTPDYGWENLRYTSPLFRQAHVEKYFEDGLMVVHVTCFPHANNPSPIFGFDVVASEKTGKVVGFFLDWSPTVQEVKWHNTQWEGERILPEWATVFSKQFIALRPEATAFEDLIQFAVKSFGKYLELLERSIPSKDIDQHELIVAAQNEYCEKQSQNPRTFNALKHKIGEERALDLLQKVIFPKFLIPK